MIRGTQLLLYLLDRTPGEKSESTFSVQVSSVIFLSSRSDYDGSIGAGLDLSPPPTH